MRELRGRDEALGALARILEAATRGEGGVLVVEGEAGIGKSAVLDHLAEQARAAGHVVLRAAGDELEQRRALGVLRGLVPELADPVVSPASNGFDLAVAGRIEIADDLLARIELRRQAGPLTIVVDDAQWADAESVHALAALVRRARVLGVVLAVGRRLRPTDALLDRLGDLATDAGGTHLRLTPLDDVAAREVAEGFHGGPLPDGIARRLGAAGGNPWLLGELVAHGSTADPGATDAAAGLPAGVAAAVRRRAVGLDDDVVLLLRSAAVLGQGFGVDELGELAQRPAASVALALADDDLRDLLVADGHQFRFAHDLFREAFEAQLPSPVAGALHREAAAIRHRRGANPLRVAAHVVRGASPGDVEAFDWLIDAADDVATTSPSTAADLLADARALCTDDQQRRRVDLLRLRMLVFGGRPHDAEPLAAALLEDETDPAQQIDLAGFRSRALFLQGRMEEAQRLVDPYDDERGFLGPQELAELGLARLFGGDVAGAHDAATRSDAAAAAAGLLTAGTLANSVLSWTSVMIGQVDTGRRHSARAIELAVESRSPQAYRFVPHLFAAVVDVACDDHAGARFHLRAGRDLGAEVGLGWDGALYDAADAVIAFQQGRWADAVAVAEAGSIAAQESGLLIGALWPPAVLALIALHRGEVDAARRALDRAEALVAAGGSLLGLEWYGWARALSFIHAGDPGTGAALLQGVLLEAGRRQVRSTVAYFGVDLARAAIAAGQPAAADAALATLADVASRTEIGWYVGTHAHVRGLVEDDADQLVAAAGVLGLGPRALEAGKAGADAALALAAAGRTDEAKDQARRATVALGGLGAVVELARLRSGLRAHGIVLREAAQADKGAVGWDALTRTERAVVALVAEGLTNASIAERLFVSRRTVESHLVHVYAKVGARSRVELATLAVGARPAAGADG